jgi:arylsulfatase A-like enzyme
MHRVRKTAARGLPVALLAVVALLAQACGTTPDEGTDPPSIILITLESLRPDHVGCYGGARDTTPALDAFAGEATVYEDAHSVTSWTLTAHASLFTGLYPTAHRSVGPNDALAESYVTLAEVLSDRGYQTAGFVSGPYLRRPHNLHQGFEVYDQSPSSVTDEEAHADVTNPEMLEVVRSFFQEERDPNRPLFLFTYFWDIHYDYNPPYPLNETFVGPLCTPSDLTEYGSTNKIHRKSPPGVLEYVKSQYDGEILWTDRHLSELFDLLRANGLWDEALIIVTSDHGQEFFEHGTKGHKNNLFVESVHVPLVIRYPGQVQSRRDPRLVSLVDVFPTVLELVGEETPAPVHGRSLRSPDPDDDRAIFYELLALWYLNRPGEESRAFGEEWAGIRQGPFKFLATSKGDRFFLYDLSTDPRETRNLIDERPDTARRLADRLREWRKRMLLSREFFEAGEAADLSPEEIERLRSLGYLR